MENQRNLRTYLCIVNAPVGSKLRVGELWRASLLEIDEPRSSWVEGKVRVWFNNRRERDQFMNVIPASDFGPNVKYEVPILVYSCIIKHIIREHSIEEVERILHENGVNFEKVAAVGGRHVLLYSRNITQIKTLVINGLRVGHSIYRADTNKNYQTCQRCHLFGHVVLECRSIYPQCRMCGEYKLTDFCSHFRYFSLKLDAYCSTCNLTTHRTGERICPKYPQIAVKPLPFIIHVSPRLAIYTESKNSDETNTESDASSCITTITNKDSTRSDNAVASKTQLNSEKVRRDEPLQGSSVDVKNHATEDSRGRSRSNSTSRNSSKSPVRQKLDVSKYGGCRTIAVTRESHERVSSPRNHRRMSDESDKESSSGNHRRTSDESDQRGSIRERSSSRDYKDNASASSEGTKSEEETIQENNDKEIAKTVEMSKIVKDYRDVVALSIKTLRGKCLQDKVLPAYKMKQYHSMKKSFIAMLNTLVDENDRIESPTVKMLEDQNQFSGQIEAKTERVEKIEVKKEMNDTESTGNESESDETTENRATKEEERSCQNVEKISCGNRKKRRTISDDKDTEPELKRRFFVKDEDGETDGSVGNILSYVKIKSEHAEQETCLNTPQVIPGDSSMENRPIQDTDTVISSKHHHPKISIAVEESNTKVHNNIEHMQLCSVGVQTDPYHSKKVECTCLSQSNTRVEAKVSTKSYGTQTLRVLMKSKSTQTSKLSVANTSAQTDKRSSHVSKPVQTDKVTQECNKHCKKSPVKRKEMNNTSTQTSDVVVICVKDQQHVSTQTATTRGENPLSPRIQEAVENVVQERLLSWADCMASFTASLLEDCIVNDVDRKTKLNGNYKSVVKKRLPGLRRDLLRDVRKRFRSLASNKSNSVSDDNFEDENDC